MRALRTWGRVSFPLGKGKEPSDYATAVPLRLEVSASEGTEDHGINMIHGQGSHSLSSAILKLQRKNSDSIPSMLGLPWWSNG